MVNKRIGQKRAIKQMKNDYFGEGATSVDIKTFADNLAIVDSNIVDQLKIVFLGTSLNKITNKNKIDDKVWTTDVSVAYEKAKKYNKYGGGVVIVHKLAESDKKECFTVIPDEIPFNEIAVQQLKRINSGELPMDQSEIKAIFDANRDVKNKNRSTDIFFMPVAHKYKCVLGTKTSSTDKVDKGEYLEIRLLDEKGKVRPIDEIIEEIGTYVGEPRSSGKKLEIE